MKEELEEELEEDEICIKIPNQPNFYCNNTWTIEEAEEKIKQIYHLNGEIKNGRQSLSNKLSFAEQLKKGIQILSFIISINFQCKLFFIPCFSYLISFYFSI